MMSIQHAGNSVKPEPIETIFLHPETKIAKKESQHFMVAIVE
jgi:hypothetical protein